MNEKNKLQLTRTTSLSTADILLFEKADKQISLPQLVQAEINTLSLPYAVLNEKEAKTSPGHELVKFEKQGSSQIVWQWKVWPDSDYGMPTIFTLRVLFGLMEIAQEAKRSLGYIPDRLEIGSLNSLCRRISVIQDRHHRKLIRKHIEILVYTTCKSKGAFKTKQGKGLVLDRFSYLKKARFAGQQDDEGNEIESNFIEFDEAFKHNLESNYIKAIDVAFMRNLKTPIAQLLYTHLSNLFNGMGNWSYVDPEYRWLAERMGLKVYSELRRARQQFKQAIGELLEQKYIAKAEWDGWNIRFYPGVRYSYGEAAATIERKRKAKLPKNRVSNLDKNALQSSVVVQEDDRDTLLIRQATRIMLRQDPDEQLLSANGWTVEDAVSKAKELKSQ